MNRTMSVAETPLVHVERFDHPPGEPHFDPPEEAAAHFSVNFLLRGSYELGIGRESWRMTPGTLFITHPRLVYICRHDGEQPRDECLSVIYKGGLDGGSTPDRVVVPMANRQAYLRWRLLRLVEDGSTPLEIESLAAELRETVEEPAPDGRRPYREGQLSWYAERVDAARGAMAADVSQDHSLGSLSRAVAMSPFHFARLFKELVGLPPHQYLLKVRLEQARTMLAGGASVSQTSLECGFRTFGHFSTLFKRHFGVSPSRCRRSPGCRPLAARPRT